LANNTAKYRTAVAGLRSLQATLSGTGIPKSPVLRIGLQRFSLRHRYRVLRRKPESVLEADAAQGAEQDIGHRGGSLAGALYCQGHCRLPRDATRPGRKPPLSAETIERVVHKTLHEKPLGATHWSIRKMAGAVGLSYTSVQKIWKAHGLKPHLVKTFKLSNDKRFVEKVTDIVGLYLDPPDKALVFSVDEKSQIQALDRTQPGLPMKKGRAGTMTHDYKRHGTTTLFAALDVASGKVIGQCMKRHRHQEWLKFLRRIDAETARHLDVHLIADNYATHKHAKVKAWLKRHPRFHMHFTPTSGSWLNQVERFFGLITGDRIRCGVFKSVAQLEAAIQEYLDHHNANPKPFVRTKSATDILEKGGQRATSVSVATLAAAFDPYNRPEKL
jgi:transposase